MHGVGERIRGVRIAQQRSLAEVASRAKISTATLSRIETGKQEVRLSLFLSIARILQVNPSELLRETRPGGRRDPVIGHMSSLSALERARFWREVATARREERGHRRKTRAANIGAAVEELLAQVELLRQEIASVRGRLKRRRKHR